MNKLIVVCYAIGMCIVMKKTELLLHSTMWMGLRDANGMQKKNDTKEYALYNFIYLKFKNKQN